MWVIVIVVAFLIFFLFRDRFSGFSHMGMLSSHSSPASRIMPSAMDIMSPHMSTGMGMMALSHQKPQGEAADPCEIAESTAKNKRFNWTVSEQDDLKKKCSILESLCGRGTTGAVLYNIATWEASYSQPVKFMQKLDEAIGEAEKGNCGRAYKCSKNTDCPIGTTCRDGVCY